MRFEEVVGIGYIVPGMRAWQARSDGFSFVIGLETLTGKEYEGYTGYTASWKSLKADMTPFGNQLANRIDGGPWKTFTEAEEACKATLKQLRLRQ
jgi:hypothetical protein